MSILFLLDLSVTFDTIDHGILINQLEKWVGLSGAVRDWSNITVMLMTHNYTISVSSNNPSSLNALFNRLNDVNIWMNNNFLRRNEQKI